MAVLMRGAEVAEGMRASLLAKVEALRVGGITPRLSIVRVGERDEDLAYERGARKRCEGLGIDVRVAALPGDITQDDFEGEFKRLCDDTSVHGILLFRPLPRHLNDYFAQFSIAPRKDVDGMGLANVNSLFVGRKGFAPCTPSAVMEMLAHYGVELEGKNVTVVGRSPVVGRPLAMLMLAANATVTLCHTRTVDLPGICRRSDIIVAAAGQPGLIGAGCVTGDSVVVDVGINVGPDGKLCGDVDFEAVAPIARAVSPVPGGVGAVTTSVLAKHVLEAADSLLALLD